MRVLFLIPKNPPPQLQGNQWSKNFKEFVELCLNKDPENRPSAKELLRHKFIQNSRKNDILRDVIERSIEYRIRIQQNNNDSDQDSDQDSSGGTNQWDYPTLKNPTTIQDGNWVRIQKVVNDTADNVSTIKVSSSNVQNNQSNKSIINIDTMRLAAPPPSSTSTVQNSNGRKEKTNTSVVQIEKTIDPSSTVVIRNDNKRNTAMSSFVAQNPNPAPIPSPRMPRGSLERAFLPALERLSRTRHGAADLDTIAAALKRAEEVSPGICDHLCTEILSSLSHPQTTNSELRKAIDRLTT